MRKLTRRRINAVLGVAVLCGAVLLSGCASEAERQQREYERYVRKSIREKEKRQAEYRKWRQTAPAPGSPEQQSGGDQPGAAGNNKPPGERYDVTIEAGPVSD